MDDTMKEITIKHSEEKLEEIAGKHWFGKIFPK
jgi:hypothetical protein